MEITPEHNARMAKMTFATVYPLYLAKIEKKGRAIEELHQVIEWLTGFDDIKIQQLIDEKATFETFFANAEFENPLTKQVRYLDKLVDELANGKKIEKILRTP
jgi:hypothetical protein